MELTADRSQGDIQCPARQYTPDGDYSCCIYKIDHQGMHKIGYETEQDDIEWTEISPLQHIAELLVVLPMDEYNQAYLLRVARYYDLQSEAAALLVRSWEVEQNRKVTIR